MKFVLFATAGHVDHGKTTLVKALTGIDTDRLPEEKKRGLTIDLGFAYLDFPQDDLRLELIDVPGHERFIKNAIAGLSSVSGVLLVVDAGEGVMPQTLEHFMVAKALGVRHGVAVLTKIDRIEEELLELAEEELKEFLKREGVDIPVVKVSALTGEGIDALKNALREEALASLESKETIPLRILVDSAFLVKGYGTVLRGSCVEGKVKEGERVVVEPLGMSSKVRKIQNHGRFVKEAQAGERVALNLPDIEHDKVERGSWVLKPDSYVKTRKLVVSSGTSLKSGRVYTLFFGMKEVKGRFSSVGNETYVLRLEDEVVARRGDRFVILDSSGKLEGGAEVLHPLPRILKKGFLRENLKLLINGYEEYLVLELGPEGLSGEFFRRLTGRAPNTGILDKVSVKLGERFYSKEFLGNLKSKVDSFIRAKIKGGVFGVQKAELIERFGLNDVLLEYLLAQAGVLRVIGEYVIDERASDLKENPDFLKLMELLGEGIKEERELLNSGVPKEILSLSIKRRYAHRLGEFLIVSDDLLKNYERKLRTLGDRFSVQEAKEVLGLTRKYLIPLLEYFDNLGITRRVGNERLWVLPARL
ncbi:selenocysteine-specific translation elongation factor SelB [Hydrogenivirga caldilitoris]|uniref:Selenocysteine-specific elongation factor n=1 Tax=Hydrogenivirga caldilitoris TaxID=246264 RepID=A0A497XWH0_9AQUI|nr:selenocysteine-specific translation elongation factor [Hydrogenivirga caldilitoris]RLJ71113.1 selenocysteine-specific translation elongation factor SelB [Hydrogenivirga caldilitoris]